MTHTHIHRHMHTQTDPDTHTHTDRSHLRTYVHHSPVDVLKQTFRQDGKLLPNRMCIMLQKIACIPRRKWSDQKTIKNVIKFPLIFVVFSLSPCAARCSHPILLFPFAIIISRVFSIQTCSFVWLNEFLHWKCHNISSINKQHSIMFDVVMQIEACVFLTRKFE